MMTSTGMGLSSPFLPKKVINNCGRLRQRWISSPKQCLFPFRIIKMEAFVHQKPGEECNKAEGSRTLSFRRNTNQRFQKMQCKAFSGLNHPIPPLVDHLHIDAITSGEPRFIGDMPNSVSALMQELFLIDLDAATAKTLIGLLGPFLSGFGFLFILRIVMSWYPKLPVEKFPYVIAYAPTEPLLAPTRKLIPPLAGVDVTPVVWFGLLSFLNEILVGPQGLLVLLSQQV